MIENLLLLLASKTFYKRLRMRMRIKKHPIGQFGRDISSELSHAMSYIYDASKINFKELFSNKMKKEKNEGKRK